MMLKENGQLSIACLVRCVSQKRARVCILQTFGRPLSISDIAGHTPFLPVQLLLALAVGAAISFARARRYGSTRGVIARSMSRNPASSGSPIGYGAQHSVPAPVGVRPDAVAAERPCRREMRTAAPTATRGTCRRRGAVPRGTASPSSSGPSRARRRWG